SGAFMRQGNEWCTAFSLDHGRVESAISRPIPMLWCCRGGPMMSAQIPESQQSLARTPARPEVAGAWRVRAGSALSLRPRRRGVLEVAQGRVWLTVNSATDHVLEAGARMTVDAGQHAVLEAWAPGAAAA